jgi:hypothetical protein
MNRISIGRDVRVTIAVVLLAIASSVVALSAKSGSPFDEVLAKLDEIIETLGPPPADAQVTLGTSPVLMNSIQHVVCLVANLGTESVEGLLRVISDDGTVLEESSLIVQPGHTSGAMAPGPGALRCEFTFEGAATSVRANLQFRNSADDSTIAIIDAR